jgi:orotidine-5'-phosphate decarboxylase
MTAERDTQDMQPGIPQEIEGVPTNRFNEMLEARQDQGFNICFGIDPDLDRYKKSFDLPEMDMNNPDGQLASFLYDRAMEYVDATAEFAAVYKPNSAFFEQYGAAGTTALHKIVSSVHEQHPEVPIIGDVKRGDIGNTQEAYARAAFEVTSFDAATVNPYMSGDAVLPFAKYKDKGTFVLVRTSNPDAAKTQDILLENGKPYWQHIAQMAVNEWNENKNIGIVMGATNPEQLSQVREIVGPDMQILTPGIGTQGGEIEKVVKAIGNNRFVANVSRSHLYPDLQEGEEYVDAVRRVSKKLHNQIQEAKAA